MSKIHPEHIVVISVIFYILMFVFTYGCKVNANYYADYDLDKSQRTDRSGCYLVESLFWPLYWSVQVTKFARGNPMKIEPQS